MSILARNTITLAKIVDVSAVTWYYKLQASTATPPAKPTTATPSGWSTTEPTYTEGSTNSLYVCQKTTFSDSTFEYSDVSLSSSYEAAKLAYNKGVAALDAANGKNKNFYLPSTTAPTGAVAGDQWFMSDKGMELYRYDGSAWEKLGLLTSVFSTVEAGGATIGQIDSMLLYFDEDNYWNLSGADFDEDRDPTNVAADVVYKSHTLKTSHLIATDDIQVIGGSGSIIKIPTNASGTSYVVLQSGGLEIVQDFTQSIGAKITTQWKTGLMPGASTVPMMYVKVDITDAVTYGSTSFDLCSDMSLETNGLVLFKQSGSVEADYLHEGITYHGYDQTSRSNANVHNFKIDPVNKAIQIGGNSTTDWTMSINGYDLSNLASGSYPTQAHMRGACAVYTYDNDTCRYMAFAVNPTSKRLFVYGSNDPTALSYIGRVDLV